MKIFKICTTLCSLLIAISAMVFSVWATVQLNFQISASVEFVVADCEIQISGKHTSGAVNNGGEAIVADTALFDPQTLTSGAAITMMNLYFNDFNNSGSIAPIVLAFTFKNLSPYPIGLSTSPGSIFDNGKQFYNKVTYEITNDNATIQPDGSHTVQVSLALLGSNSSFSPTAESLLVFTVGL